MSAGWTPAPSLYSPINTTRKAGFSLADHSPDHYTDVFEDDSGSPPLWIEPVFAQDANASQSADPQVGLGDISEAAEEEAENVDAEEGTSPPPPKQEEVIQGLRISTSFSSPVSHLHGNIPFKRVRESGYKLRGHGANSNMMTAEDTARESCNRG